jgi:hypothetical protein
MSAMIALFLGVGCVGFGFDAPQVLALAPHPVSIVLPAGFERDPRTDRAVYRHPEDGRAITVAAAQPGGAAATRSVSEALPGATVAVDWVRPYAYDGHTGTEARVTEASPTPSTHWIAAIDLPSGVVFVDVAIPADVGTIPDGDTLWREARDTIRYVPP